MLHGTRPWVWLAVIAMLALLVGFDRVVREGVQQGVMRRAADLDRSNALWRCNMLAGRPARTECLLALR